jgi:cephalosporin-C deacetylase-like acetyl esterase
MTAAQPPLDITNGPWKIRFGDDVSWSRFDHESNAGSDAWRPIQVDAGWEEQGFENRDGYAWYQLRFPVPESWRNRPDVLERQTLRLDLGWIDDVDETWFNGVSIGRTGQFPPAYQLAYREERKYIVPAKLVHWGGDNTIAIRVYDGEGRGGMYSGKCRLTVADWNDLVGADFNWDGGNGLFSGDDSANILFKVRNRSTKSVKGTLDWKLLTDEGEPVSGSQDAVAVPLRNHATFEKQFRIPGPGFYNVKCELESTELDLKISRSFTIGFEPEGITAQLTQEDDFDSFWSDTLKELAEVPSEIELIRESSRDSETHEVYEVKMRSLGGVRVGGWYEKPKAKGPHPALLRVPGYGGNMQPSGRGDAIAVFSFNVRGHGNSREDVKGEPQNFWIRGLDAPKGYYYQGAFSDCVRAVDFLASRAEIDAKRIAVTGGSQGGGLSLATAALDSRIALCAPDIAFLCDWKKYFTVTDWPEIDAWISAAEHRTWKSTLKTMSYFDTLNMAERIQCPVFFGIGLQDDVCPAATIFAVFNRISTEKEYRVYLDAKHWVPNEHREEKIDWLNAHFQTSEQ